MLIVLRSIYKISLPNFSNPDHFLFRMVTMFANKGLGYYLNYKIPIKTSFGL